MVRIRRVEGRRHVPADPEITLVSTTWTISLGGGGLWVGGRYQGPRRVESAGSSIPILDHLLIARVAGAILLLAAVAYRRTLS